jgi:hypothetical protein
VDNTGVLELRGVPCEAGFVFLWVAVDILPLLSWVEVVGVLLGQDLLVLDWLDSGVVVMLVDLPVYSLSGLLMAVRLDGFAGDTVLNEFIDLSGVALAGGEILNGGFCSFHIDVIVLVCVGGVGICSI